MCGVRGLGVPRRKRGLPVAASKDVPQHPEHDDDAHDDRDPVHPRRGKEAAHDSAVGVVDRRGPVSLGRATVMRDCVSAVCDECASLRSLTVHNQRRRSTLKTAGEPASIARPPGCAIRRHHGTGGRPTHHSRHRRRDGRSQQGRPLLTTGPVGDQPNDDGEHDRREGDRSPDWSPRRLVAGRRRASDGIRWRRCRRARACQSQVAPPSNGTAQRPGPARIARAAQPRSRQFMRIAGVPQLMATRLEYTCRVPAYPPEIVRHVASPTGAGPLP